MRSFFLFICCFLSIGGGIFLGFKGLQTPSIPLAEASSLRMRTIWVPTVKSAYHAGDIISKKDVLWLEGQIEEADTVFLSRKAFEAEPSSFLVTRTALKDGSILENAQVIWPSDENYLRTALKPAHVAITLSQEAFSVLKPENHPAGTVIDIYLDKITSKSAPDRILDNFPLLIARTVRILKWAMSPENKGRANIAAVTVEVRESELKALMLAKKAGSLAAIASTNGSVVASIDPSLNAISTLRAAFAPVPPIAVKPKLRKILLHRGGERETVSIGFSTPSHVKNIRSFTAQGVGQ